MFCLKLIVILLSPLLIIYLLLKYYFRLRDKRYRNANHLRDDTKIIAFFHPYCNSGGGGERVLWVALRALHQKYPNCHFVVYTGDITVKAEDIVQKCENNFQIQLNFSINFVYLWKRHYISADLYPYFTLLGQSLGSILLAFEAIHKCVPNVLIDSMGFAFIFPVFKYLGNSCVGAYVHYPTISTDMLSMVSKTVTTYNNRSFISNSRVLTRAKLIYYKLFAYFYGMIGRTADVVMVNSSWTQQHIQQIWKCKAHRVYPPCNTDEFKQLSLQNKNQFQIVSIGQIRPEKNHSLQLKAFKQLTDRLQSEGKPDLPKLVIIGSCRDAEDEHRVLELKKLSHNLKIENRVEFKLNIPFKELKQVIEESSIGLHTMINEHFGIGVVECLAAGLITVAHESGGPKMDIIVDGLTGFLANDSENFAEILYKILNLDENQINSIRIKSRESVDRFSELEFEKLFLKYIEPILPGFH